MTETPFLTFWRGLNAVRQSAGNPPIALGHAEALWRLWTLSGYRVPNLRLARTQRPSEAR